MWQGEEYAVTLVEDRRRVLFSATGALTTTFIVSTAAGQRFRLGYDQAEDNWSVQPIP